MGEFLLDTLQKPAGDNFPHSLESQLREQFQANITFGYISLISYSAIGFYLLFFGKAFHTLLTRIPLAAHDEVVASDEKEEPSIKHMQRLYREFMTNEGSSLPTSSKERHEHFRLWLAEKES